MWAARGTGNLGRLQAAFGLAADAFAPEGMKLGVGGSGHGLGSCEETGWSASQVTKHRKPGDSERLQITKTGYEAKLANQKTLDDAKLESQKTLLESAFGARQQEL